MDKSVKFTETVASFVELVSKVLPDDVAAKLAELRAAEKVPMAKAVYDCMFENMRLSAELSRPLCQDTGVIQYFLRVGTRFPLIDELEPLLLKATEIATEKRPFAITRWKLSRRKTPARIPVKKSPISNTNSFRAPTNWKWTYIWRAAAVRFRGARRCLCRARATKA